MRRAVAPAPHWTAGTRGLLRTCICSMRSSHPYEAPGPLAKTTRARRPIRNRPCDQTTVPRAGNCHAVQGRWSSPARRGGCGCLTSASASARGPQGAMADRGSEIPRRWRGAVDTGRDGAAPGRSEPRDIVRAMNKPERTRGLTACRMCKHYMREGTSRGLDAVYRSTGEAESPPGFRRRPESLRSPQCRGDLTLGGTRTGGRTAEGRSGRHPAGAGVVPRTGTTSASAPLACSVVIAGSYPGECPPRPGQRMLA
jgi:hypothetical protein